MDRYRTHRTRAILIALVYLVVFAASTAVAQGASTADLERRVAELEAKVARLEQIVSSLTGAPTTPTGATTPSAASTPHAVPLSVQTYEVDAYTFTRLEVVRTMSGYQLVGQVVGPESRGAYSDPFTLTLYSATGSIAATTRLHIRDIRPDRPVSFSTVFPGRRDVTAASYSITR